MWFDSHCHLDFEAFEQDRRQVVEAAREAQVFDLFVPGVSLEQWSRLPPLAAEVPGLCFGFGLHPFFLKDLRQEQIDNALDQLPDWCRRHGAVAVGECGLDAIHGKRGGVALELQTKVFERHVRIASELGLPLIVHAVRAHGKVLETLRAVPLERGGVVHAYSGSKELIAEYADLGFYFGFGAAALRDRARRAQESLRAVPAERLLLETDAPDQALAVGERNEPCRVVEIGRQLAQLRGISEEALAELTTRNAKRLFRSGS